MNNYNEYILKNTSILDVNNGNINDNTNPNGSSNNIAGILNSEKNILGMMPHPERMIEPLLSGEDGSLMFESLFNKK